MDRFPADIKMPRTILAFDTAMSSCSVACACLDAGIFHEKVVPMPRGQAETLVPMIDKIIQEAGINYENLEAIATTVGPGAFTGLRIGLSTARALGMALDIYVLGFSTLELILYRFMQERVASHGNEMANKPILVVLETKRQDFYTQIFSANGNALTEPMALAVENIFSVIESLEQDSDSFVVIGDAVARFKNESAKYDGNDLAYKLIYCNEYCFPEPMDMIRMIEGGHRALPAKPLYLRDADVSKPKKNYRTIDNLK